MQPLLDSRVLRASPGPHQTGAKATVTGMGLPDSPDR